MLRIFVDPNTPNKALELLSKNWEIDKGEFHKGLSQLMKIGLIIRVQDLPTAEAEVHSE